MDDGDHEDRDPQGGGVVPQRLRHVEAVDVGHHHVERDEVGAEGTGHPHGLVTVDRLVHDVAVALQLLAEQLADGLVVVDDEDVRRTAGPVGARVVAQVAYEGAGVEDRRIPGVRGLGRGARDRYRQGEGEGRPATHLAVDVDVPAVVLDDLLADGQPQPGALWLAGQRVADLLEPHEEVRTVRRCDAGAGVGDRHDHVPGLATRRDGHAIPSR